MPRVGAGNWLPRLKDVADWIVLCMTLMRRIHLQRPSQWLIKLNYSRCHRRRHRRRHWCRGLSLSWKIMQTDDRSIDDRSTITFLSVDCCSSITLSCVVLYFGTRLSWLVKHITSNQRWSLDSSHNCLWWLKPAWMLCVMLMSWLCLFIQLSLNFPLLIEFPRMILFLCSDWETLPRALHYSMQWHQCTWIVPGVVRW